MKGVVSTQFINNNAIGHLSNKMPMYYSCFQGGI